MKKLIAGGLVAAFALGFINTKDANALERERNGILSRIFSKKKQTVTATETVAPPVSVEKKEGAQRLPAGEPKKEPTKPTEAPKKDTPKPADAPKKEAPKPAEAPKKEATKPTAEPKKEAGQKKPVAEPKKEAPKPAADPKKEAASFVPLFNGKNFDGWTQKGGKANYKVVNGEVVGTSVPNTSNSFMCTNKEYGNFILEVDFKVHPTLNSGIQIRSQVFESAQTGEIQGKKFNFPAGRVHGYQVEIDPSDRAYSGGIYDEGRRGWLNDLSKNEAARKAFKKNEWNHFRIECKGDSIKTFINGVQAADLKDSVTPKGLIALQVHGVGAKTEPLEVRWKNIMIQELK